VKFYRFFFQTHHHQQASKRASEAQANKKAKWIRRSGIQRALLLTLAVESLLICFHSNGQVTTQK